MSDQKLSQLTELGSAPATSDLLYLDHSGTSNSLTVNHLFTSPTLITPALGTPVSGNLANTTGFPTANLSGLGTGIATFLATPSSANLATTITDETGTGALVFANTPTLVTPVLGVATATNVSYTNNAITASSNAATVPITSRLNTVTNSSAATLTITITTSSAVDGQLVMVRVLDFSAVAQTITWVNTENSTVTATATSNGSTTLPVTVGFQYNGGTSKWRCIAAA